MSEIPSSGGFDTATSFDKSPVVLLGFAGLEDAALPKNDMIEREVASTGKDGQ